MTRTRPWLANHLTEEEGGNVPAAADLSRRVRDAHGDAWQEEGRLRAGTGGGRVELPGIRLMASGLPHPQWNNGDVTDPALVDLQVVHDWYAARAVPWGVRVPHGIPWSAGRRLFSKRLMGLEPARFVPAPKVAGLVVRAAVPGDLDAVVDIDRVAFDGDSDSNRPWIEPHLTFSGATVAIGLLNDKPVATAYSLHSDGIAGPALYVAGVGVLPEARRLGVGGALSSWLVEAGLAAGAHLAHLHPDTDLAARIYSRLGFVEVDGFEVFVDIP